MNTLVKIGSVPIGTFAVVLGCYVLGCFCTGYYLVRFLTGKDIRQLGTGNVGARNAGTILGRYGLIITFMGDVAKGTLAVWIAKSISLGPWGVIISMIAVILGHLYPLQLRFKGGKGVSAFIGAILLIDYRLALLLVVLFALLMIVIRNFTTAGLIAITLLPVTAIRFVNERIFLFGIGIAACFVLAAHKKDILRAVRSFKHGKETSRT